MEPYLITRTATATVRAVTPESGGDDVVPGTFRAIVSVFGNTDSYGDVVEKGAFKKTLAEWVLRNGLPPVVWSHKFGEPENFLGKHFLMEETDQGLEVEGVLNLDRPKAKAVWELMLEGTIREFSWSGMVREAEPIEDDDSDSWWPAMRILDVELWEAGPCFKGANPATELISVKTDPRLEAVLRTPEFASKAGRVLSKENLESLRSARDQIEKVLAAAEDSTDTPESTESKSVPGAPVGKVLDAGDPVDDTEKDSAGDVPAGEATDGEVSAVESSDSEVDEGKDTGPAARAIRDEDIRVLLDLSSL